MLLFELNAITRLLLLNIITREKEHGTCEQNREESYLRILVERGSHCCPQRQLLAVAPTHSRGCKPEGSDDCQVSQILRLPPGHF